MIAHAHGHDNEKSIGTEHWLSMDIGGHPSSLATPGKLFRRSLFMQEQGTRLQTLWMKSSP